MEASKDAIVEEVEDPKKREELFAEAEKGDEEVELVKPLLDDISPDENPNPRPLI